jgi:hypothetical protein
MDALIQTDNPQTISKQLESEHPSADWLFCIDGAGQFDIRFSLWYRESNNDDPTTIVRA